VRRCLGKTKTIQHHRYVTQENEEDPRTSEYDEPRLIQSTDISI